MRILRLAFCCALSALVNLSAISADKPKAEKPQAAKPAPAAKAPKADLFKVPAGTPDEILAFVEKLGQQQPESDDAASVTAFRKKLFTAVVQAADKILAAKANDEQAETAVQLKAQGLLALAGIGLPDAGKRLEAMPAELEKMKRPRLARQVKAILLSRRINGLVRGGPAELQALVADLKQYLGQQPQPDDLELVISALEAAEGIDPKLAAGYYTSLGKLLSASKNAEVASAGAKLQGAGRRLSLVGQKMDLEGTTLAGKPFRLDDQRGKAVLVVFWATWCGPCRAEIPVIKEAYEAYHKRGLEVVSISLDKEREDLEAFVKENKIPWTVLFDTDPQRHGFEHPMAVRYGVMAIPAMVLLDREGKGAALDPRGPELREELAKLLGSAPDAKPKTTAVEGTVIPLPLPAIGTPRTSAKP